MAPLNNVARMNVGNRPELSQQEAPQLRDPGPAQSTHSGVQTHSRER